MSGRRCERCGAILRSTQSEDLCSPCQGAVAAERAPVVLVVKVTPTPTERAAARRERIVELCAGRDQTAWSLASILGVKHRTARTDLDLLEGQGRVERVGLDAQRRLYRATAQDAAA